MRPLTGSSPVSLDLVSARESAVAVLFGSIDSQPVAFKGGTLVANPWSLFVDLMTDAQGEVHLATTWPAAIPSDLELWFQVALADDAAPHGVALSNGLRAITP